MEPGGLAYELVEGRVAKVGELYLRNRDDPVQRSAYRRAHDARLGQRRVHAALLAEFGSEAVGGSKDAALADIFAHHDYAVVALHLFEHRVTDGFHHCFLRHESILQIGSAEGAGADRFRPCFDRFSTNGKRHLKTSLLPPRRVAEPSALPAAAPARPDR